MIKVDRDTFITKLLDEVDAIDENLFKPFNEVKVNEKSKILGIVSPYARKLYAAQRLNQREARQLKLDSDFGPIDEGRAEEVSIKAKILGDLFWACTVEALGWSGKSRQITISADWRLVELGQDD